MKHTWILLSGLFLIISGCQQAAPPPEKPALLVPPTFGRGWKFASNNKSPIVSMYCREDNVFAYTESGVSYVLDRKTGKLLHIDTVPNATGKMPSPVILKDSIVYTTPDALQIFDKRGNISRSIPLSYTLTSGAAGTKDSLFVAQAAPDGGRMAAVDLTMIGGIDYNPQPTPTPAKPVRWEYLVQHAGIISTPAILKDAVYVAAEDGSVAALSGADREPLWPVDNGVFQCGAAVVADLAIDDFGVYVASTDSKLYCLNPNNGKVRWQYYAEAPLTSAPVATKDLVFQLVPNGGIVAIDKFAGVDRNKPPTYDRTPRWTAADCSQFLSEDQKYVYLLRNDKHISARDKITGVEAFASKRADFIAVAVNDAFGKGTTPADSSVYATTAAGEIISINAITLPGTIGEVVLDNTTQSPANISTATACPSRITLAQAQEVRP